jgi:hypothetical protein
MTIRPSAPIADVIQPDNDRPDKPGNCREAAGQCGKRSVSEYDMGVSTIGPDTEMMQSMPDYDAAMRLTIAAYADRSRDLSCCCDQHSDMG